MLDLVLGAIAVLLLVIVYAIGFKAGRRTGREEGKTEYQKLLLVAKDQECWVAAHYLVTDEITQAQTERMPKRKA